MLRERVIPIVVFLPIIVILILLGGWPYTAGVTLGLALAAYEFSQIYRVQGLRPARPVLLAGVILLTLGRHVFGFVHAPLALTLLVLFALIWHVTDYELGAKRSGTDFALTLAGTIYLGWLGGYLISLRDLPAGSWWVLLIIPTMWFADISAFLIGSAIGRRSLVPRLSPKKTWEGYVAGIVVGGASALLLTLLWTSLEGAASAPSPVFGLLVGLLVSAFAPVGDLGISMIKRELRIKDTGSLFLGHGGALDRIDTWLWAGVLGYYAVVWIAL